MPIRINLLSEVIATEQERRNDPVKRAIWVAGFSVFLVLLWYSMLLMKQMVVASGLEERTTEWERLEPDAKELAAISRDIRDAADRIAALDRLATNRFLWTPVLNALQYVVVDHVKLVRFSSSQSYTVVLPPKSEKTSPRSRTKLVPPTATERIMITLEARDYGEQAEEKNYSAFRDAIAQSDFFKNKLSPKDGLRLANVLPPTTDASSENRTFLPFTIECRFPETERK